MSRINFDTINYLRAGNGRQRQAFEVLRDHNIMAFLLPFDPVLVGTIPINIDIENSDLDIACCCVSKERFISVLKLSFGAMPGFHLQQLMVRDVDTVVANFVAGPFEIEIFGQNVAVSQQFAYRHMLIEHQILAERGELFRQQVIELKKQGYKTEPAFAKLLGIEGDAYLGLLNYQPGS